jgi:hypothetical protein
VIDLADVLDKGALLPTIVPQGVKFPSLVGRIKPGEALVSTAAQLAPALLGLKLIQMQGSGQAPTTPDATAYRPPSMPLTERCRASPNSHTGARLDSAKRVDEGNP